MRLLLNVIIIIAGICGAVICLVSDIVVSSPVSHMNQLELSSWLIVFFIFVFISGFYNLLDSLGN